MGGINNNNILIIIIMGYTILTELPLLLVVIKALIIGSKNRTLREWEMTQCQFNCIIHDWVGGPISYVLQHI